VFGIGMQEMLIVGLLFLVIFGPNKLPGMSRDLGRFVKEARRLVEEFKDDLVSEGDGDQEPRKGQDPEASREPEESVRRDDVAAIDRNAPHQAPLE
jgi:TatA/E family protein of Tat protein translocase